MLGGHHRNRLLPSVQVAFTKFNPLDKVAGISLTNSDLTATNNVPAVTGGVRCIDSKSTGRATVEFRQNLSVLGAHLYGLSTLTVPIGTQADLSTNIISVYPVSGDVFQDGVVANNAGLIDNNVGAIYGMAVDFDLQFVSYSLNGVELITNFDYGVKLGGIVPMTPSIFGDLSNSLHSSDIITDGSLFSFAQKAGYPAGWTV